MRRKERPFSDSPGENRGRVNDLVQHGNQAAGAKRENLTGRCRGPTPPVLQVQESLVRQCLFSRNRIHTRFGLRRNEVPRDFVRWDV